ncbi:hypothetical protein GQ457_17G027640 [Hibiscus cannabinus]
MDKDKRKLVMVFGVAEREAKVIQRVKENLKHIHKPLSEQELVDCDNDNEGCDGGLMEQAFELIKKSNGLTTENNYPYRAKYELSSEWAGHSNEPKSNVTTQHETVGRTSLVACDNLASELAKIPTKLAKTKKNQQMAKTSDLSEIQNQLTKIQNKLNELEDEENVPKWWNKQKEASDQRITNLEKRIDVTQGYLEKILEAVSKQGGQSSPETAKKSIHWFSYKPEEPGLIASKPLHTPLPQTKLKMKMGEPKMDLVAMHLEGKAKTWFDGYIMQKHKLNWHEFTADLCHRFCDRAYTDIIEEFNKLVQRTTVDEYQERFEELKPYIIQQNPYQEETYFVSSFLSGLKEELRYKVKINQPGSLNEAYRLAKLHELALELETKRLKPKTYPHNPQSSFQKTWSVSANNQPKPTNQNNTKQSLLEYRRANNLCFKCGDKFTPAHQCKPKQLNLMEEELDQLEENEGLGEEEGKKRNTRRKRCGRGAGNFDQCSHWEC